MKKKRTFIRGLWGPYAEFVRKASYGKARMPKIQKDIDRMLACKLDSPFIMYVFGSENFELCKKMGMNCELMSENPIEFHVYRHKLEIIKTAMEEYDEIVYLDIDCVPVKPVTEQFWNTLGEKDVLQSPMMRYRQRNNVTPWRGKSVYNGHVPNGGFVYMRDKTLPDIGIEGWEKSGRTANDEVAWAYVTDQMMGIQEDFINKQDIFLKEYFRRFEPLCAATGSRSVFRHWLYKKNTIVVQHGRAGKVPPLPHEETHPPLVDIFREFRV